MNFFSAFFLSSSSWNLSGCHCIANFLYACEPIDLSGLGHKTPGNYLRNLLFTSCALYTEYFVIISLPSLRKSNKASTQHAKSGHHQTKFYSIPHVCSGDSTPNSFTSFNLFLKFLSLCHALLGPGKALVPLERSPVIADGLVEHILGQVSLRPLAVQPRLVVNPDCFCARLLRSSSIPCHHLTLT